MNQWEIVLQLALRFIVIALWVGSVALLLSSSPVQSIVIEPLAAAIGLVFSSIWTIGKGRAQDGFESSLSRAQQLDSRLRQTTDLFLFAILAALLGLAGWKGALFSLSWGLALIPLARLLWVPFGGRFSWFDGLSVQKPVDFEQKLWLGVQIAVSAYMIGLGHPGVSLAVAGVGAFLLAKKNIRFFLAAFAAEAFVAVGVWAFGLFGSWLAALMLAFLAMSLAGTMLGVLMNVIWDPQRFFQSGV